ncbi:MAG: 16S rRNA (guanine(966)-N(2))-methyltransferase RsmD [Lachnospiraceae bacterium]|nr:16S rRNA (guanine(966)-N(2))-methyltransferase RsmD [Ruminococcus sp.]MCM1275667.1 16S rRNA (guanine(966)-N(2))-methyltransferase RsmD [Lachnospiraceae bacterium]
MRVITGTARGRRLITVEGTDVVRPTTDGVKEAIFSAIQFEIEGRTVLDLFAGSGQLGIEALSRGACECWFVDSAAVSIKAVRANIESTGFADRAHIMNMPFSAFLKSTGAAFDVALLDPPYNHKLIQKALPTLAEKMTERGVIVCEHEKECVLPREVGGFELVKLLRHGRISLSIYRREDNEE